MRLLVVEDNTRLADALVRGLAAEGYDVDHTADGIDGAWRASEFAYDVIVLDILLPGMNGFAICRDLRGRGVTTPILMLTAKDGHEDEAEGLELGADDYLTKPFHFGVLLARINALIRRANPTPGSSTIRSGALTIDTGMRSCAYADRTIPFSARELAVIEALARAHRPAPDTIGAARSRVGRRPRDRFERGRRVHPQPAPQARAGRRPGRAHPDRARHRLPDGIGMRLGIRPRLAIVVAALFACTAGIGSVVLLRFVHDRLVDDATRNAETVLDTYLREVADGTAVVAVVDSSNSARFFYLDADGTELTETEYIDAISAALPDSLPPLSAGDVPTVIVGRTEVGVPPGAAAGGITTQRVTDPGEIRADGTVGRVMNFIAERVGGVERIERGTGVTAVAQRIRLVDGAEYLVGTSSPLAPIDDSVATMRTVLWLTVPAARCDRRSPHPPQRGPGARPGPTHHPSDPGDQRQQPRRARRRAADSRRHR